MRIANAVLVAAVCGAGCAGTSAMMHPTLGALPIAELSSLPPDLSRDPFKRDQAGGVSEEDLRNLLGVPVFIDETQRLGVLPVVAAYQPDRALPIPPVPAELTRSLEAAGTFQAVSEISADWPTDGNLPGLRELAARYRAAYLLLYRHRFLDENSTNAWCLLYPTIIGAIIAPSRTLETAGVLEATLFDVRTGTLLFTVYERVEARSDATPIDDDRKLRSMKLHLLQQAGDKLAAQVVSKVRHLIAMKPAGNAMPAATARAGPSS